MLVFILVIDLSIRGSFGENIETGTLEEMGRMAAIMAGDNSRNTWITLRHKENLQ